MDRQAFERLMDENKTLREELANTRAALNEETALREKLSKILTATANALKGEPPALTLHSWHDLAEVAGRLREERDALRKVVSQQPPAADAISAGWLEPMAHAELLELLRKAEQYKEEIVEMAEQAKAEAKRCQRMVCVANMPFADVWLWGGKREELDRDGIKLICPVVMEADTLRELLQRAEKAETDPYCLPDKHGVIHCPECREHATRPLGVAMADRDLARVERLERIEKAAKRWAASREADCPLCDGGIAAECACDQQTKEEIISFQNLCAALEGK